MEGSGINVVQQESFRKMNLAMRQHYENQEQDLLRKVPFGDLFRPIFSQKGELKGVEIDSELTPLLFIAHGQKMQIVQRAIKTCSFINRLIQDGHTEDFQLTTKASPQGFSNVKKIDALVQVDVVELKNNGLKGDDGVIRQSPGDLLLNSLKFHLAGVIGREASAYADQYRRILLSLEIEDFAKYSFNNVKLKKSDSNKKKKITALEYFHELLEKLLEEIKEVRIDQRDKLIIQDLFTLGPKYVSSKYRRSKEVQAEVEMKQKQTGTDNDSIVSAQTYVETSKQFVNSQMNQLNIDHVIKCELQKTLSLFDEFVNMLSTQSSSSTQSQTKPRRSIILNEKSNIDQKSLQLATHQSADNQSTKKAKRVVAFTSIENLKPTKLITNLDNQMSHPDSSIIQIEKVLDIQSKLRDSIIHVTDSNLSILQSNNGGLTPTISEVIRDNDFPTSKELESKTVSELFPGLQNSIDNVKPRASLVKNENKNDKMENQQKFDSIKVDQQNYIQIGKQIKPIPIPQLGNNTINLDLKEQFNIRKDKVHSPVIPKLKISQKTQLQYDTLRKSKEIKPNFQIKQTLKKIDAENLKNKYANQVAKKEVQNKDKQKAILTDRYVFNEKYSTRIMSPADTPDDISTFMKSVMGSHTIDNKNTGCLTSQMSSYASPPSSSRHGRISVNIKRQQQDITQMRHRAENNTKDRRKTFGIMTPPDPNISNIPMFGINPQLNDRVIAAKKMAGTGPLVFSGNEERQENEFARDLMNYRNDIVEQQQINDAPINKFDQFLRQTLSPQGDRPSRLLFRPPTSNVPPNILNRAIEIRSSLKDQVISREITRKRQNVQTSMSINQKGGSNWLDNMSKNNSNDAKKDIIKARVMQHSQMGAQRYFPISPVGGQDMSSLKVARTQIVNQMVSRTNQPSPQMRFANEKQQFDEFKRMTQSKLEKLSKQDDLVQIIKSRQEQQNAIFDDQLKQQNVQDVQKLQQNLQILKKKDQILRTGKASKIEQIVVKNSYKQKKQFDSQMNNIDQLIKEFNRNEQQRKKETIEKIQSLLDQKDESSIQSQQEQTASLLRIQQLNSSNLDEISRSKEDDLSYDQEFTRFDGTPAESVDLQLIQASRKRPLEQTESKKTDLLEKQEGIKSSQQSSLEQSRAVDKSPKVITFNTNM